jgi:hypothetical protein
MLEKFLYEQRADAEPERLRTLGSAAKPQHLVIGIQHSTRLIEDQFAECRRRGPVWCFPEQLAAEQILDAFHLRTYGRLTEAEPLSRPRQTSGLRNGDNGPNYFDRDIQMLMSSVHPEHPSNTRNPEQ